MATPSPNHRRPVGLARLLMRLALLAGVTVGTVVAVDVGYGATGRDMEKVATMLYTQDADSPAYEWSDDPVLHYTLRRGYASRQATPIHTDRYGARGAAPRAEGADADAALRILWFGASTIFGANLADDETLPARTEAHLQPLCDVPVEVWNYGHSGYSKAQIARLATTKLGEVPAIDLVLITETNNGRSPFVRPTEPSPRALRAHIDRDPVGWLAIFPEPPAIDRVPPEVLRRGHWFLLRRSAAYRAWQAARVGQQARAGANAWTDFIYERERTALVDAARAAGVPVLHVLYPEFASVPADQAWMTLERPGLSRAAVDPHPPAKHMDAHGAFAAAQLRERGIVGADGGVDLGGASTDPPVPMYHHR